MLAIHSPFPLGEGRGGGQLRHGKPLREKRVAALCPKQGGIIGVRRNEWHPFASREYIDGSRGGHHILEDVIRRRYERGLKNLFELYIPFVDIWEVQTNRNKEVESTAYGQRHGTVMVNHFVDWKKIQDYVNEKQENDFPCDRDKVQVALDQACNNTLREKALHGWPIVDYTDGKVVHRNAQELYDALLAEKAAKAAAAEAEGKATTRPDSQSLFYEEIWNLYRILYLAGVHLSQKNLTCTL